MIAEARDEALEHRRVERALDLALRASARMCSRQSSVVQSRRENAMIVSDSAQRAGGLQVIQRRQQLVRREIAGGTENHERNTADCRLNHSCPGSSQPSLTAWPPKPLRIMASSLSPIIVLALAGEAHHQRERHHRRRHALLDRFERGPAALAGIRHEGCDVVERLIAVPENPRSDPAARSAPRCRAATARRSAARSRSKSRLALHQREALRQRPASCRTRCRYEPS